jgi:Sortase domain
MVRARPFVGRLHRAPMVFAGEVALTMTLGVTLALAWSDGTPSDDPFHNWKVPKLSTVASAQVPAHHPYDTSPVLDPKPPPASPVPQTPIPTSPPVRLFLPTLNLHPPVEPLGLDRYGAMDTPNNIWDVGWYNAGPVPGAPGDAVMDGHAGYPGQPLIFGRLAKIQPGEPIWVVLADGSKQVFTVVSVTSWPANSMPPNMFEPYGPPRLTLVTCDGDFNSDTKTYASRLVVEAGFAGVGT